MTSALEARVGAAADGARIVLTGRIDRDGEEALTAAYATARATGPGAIILDFAETGYINSTGIALIVRLLADARRDGRPVRAVGLTDHYREIFRITRLSDFMAIEDGTTTDGTTTDEPTSSEPRLDGGTR